MKKVTVALFIGIFLAVAVSSVHAYEAFQGHTGVIIFDEVNAMRAFTLLDPGSETTVYLIDMQGFIRHRWDLADTIPTMVPASFPAASTDRTSDPLYNGVDVVNDLRPGLHSKLLENGNILRGYRPSVFDAAGDEISISTAGGAAGGVQEIDPDGNLVWFYILKDIDQIQHHSFYRVEDPSSPSFGNTFILAWELRTCAEALALGRDPATCGGAGPEAAGLWPDWIREVNPAKQTVWEWRVWDHTTTTETDPAKFYINALASDPVILNNRDWTHGNTVEFNPVTGHVLINFRNWGEFFLVDHDGTFVPGDPATSIANAAGPGGDIIFRWGNVSSYAAGEAPIFNDDGDQETFGSHCAVFLGVDATNGAGTPGNLLTFDNGWNRPQGNRSRSVELTAAGIGGDPNDWLVPDLGGNSPEVWSYQAGDQGSFYTAFQGGTQRIYEDATTGETWTFVTSTGEGHLFQVYHDPAAPGSGNTVVWDFVNPRRDEEGVAECFHFDSTDSSIHRAHQYLSTHPGLADYRLNSVGHIAGNCTQFWDLWGEPVVAGEEPPPLTGFGFSGFGIGGGGQGGGAGGGSGGY
jgi:hypothetical protein